MQSGESSRKMCRLLTFLKEFLALLWLSEHAEIQVARNPRSIHNQWPGWRQSMRWCLSQAWGKQTAKSKKKVISPYITIYHHISHNITIYHHITIHDDHSSTFFFEQTHWNLRIYQSPIHSSVHREQGFILFCATSIRLQPTYLRMYFPLLNCTGSLVADAVTVAECSTTFQPSCKEMQAFVHQHLLSMLSPFSQHLKDLKDELKAKSMLKNYRQNRRQNKFVTCGSRM